MNQTTVSISSVRSILHYLQNNHYIDEAGLEMLVSEIGIPSAYKSNQELRLPINSYLELWSRAEKLTEDPAIGIKVGQQSQAELMGLVGQVLVHSDTLEKGIEQYVRLFSLVNNGMDLNFERIGRLSIIEFNYHKPEYYCRADIDRTLTLAIMRTRQFVNNEIRLEKVGVAHDKPVYAEEYEKVFECPVEFGQEVSSITFSSRFLHFSPKQKNPYAQSALLGYAEAIHNRLFKRKIGDKVRDIVIEMLPQGKIDIDSVAQRLHMSRQTLYRKLKKEELIFQELVENIRREKALEIIQDESLSLSEIAFVLGFSELSAFSRAFKRWTGTRPRQYRSEKLDQ